MLACVVQATEVDQPLTVEAGSVVVIHGDTWHRAMINYSGDTRYMLKFYFVRVEEPYMATGPSWNHKGDATWTSVDGPGQDDDAAEATWRWLLGRSPVEPAVCSAAPMALLAEDNEVSSEKERVDAIFACASAAAADRRVAEELVGMLGSGATKAAVEDILLEAFSHSTRQQLHMQSYRDLISRDISDRLRVRAASSAAGRGKARRATHLARTRPTWI